MVNLNDDFGTMLEYLNLKPIKYVTQEGPKVA